MMVLLNFLLIVIPAIFDHVQGGRGTPDLSSHKATRGEPWPLPQSISTSAQYLLLHPDRFDFVYNDTSVQCDVVTNAFARYYKLIFFPETYWDDLLQQPSSNKMMLKQKVPKTVSISNDTTLLAYLSVNIQQTCEHWPSFESNESCNY